MGATLTNTVNAKTFYNVGFSMNSETFKTEPNSRRLGSNPGPGDNASLIPDAVIKLYGSGGVNADSLVYTPWGWTSDGMSNPGSGSRLGGHWARGRDDSKVSSTNINLDRMAELANKNFATATEFANPSSLKATLYVNSNLLSLFVKLIN